MSWTWQSSVKIFKFIKKQEEWPHVAPVSKSASSTSPVRSLSKRSNASSKREPLGCVVIPSRAHRNLSCPKFSRPPALPALDTRLHVACSAERSSWRSAMRIGSSARWFSYNGIVEKSGWTGANAVPAPPPSGLSSWVMGRLLGAWPSGMIKIF